MTVRALLLPVGREWYAIDTTVVREVVAEPLVVPLPTAPATLLGVFNLRGEIIPLFDTAALLGVGRSADHPYAAVVDTGLGPAALAGHAMPEMADLTEQVGPSELLGSSGTFMVGRRPTALLDIDVVLAPANVGGWEG